MTQQEIPELREQLHKENSDKEDPSAVVFVVTHKSYRMPEDEVYCPMQVGAALSQDSKGREQDLGYVKDNAGENISARNASFCELTGLYWAWKHCPADYIGLVHYRRHFRGDGKVHSGIRRDIFDEVLRGDELMPLLKKYKVILPRKRYYIIETLWSHYDHTHYVEHLEKTREIIQEKYPDYLPSFDKVMKQSSAHMFNMMVMRRDLLDAYCRWLFDILFELERRTDGSRYSFFQGRYCGRIGELSLNVWIDRQLKTGVLSHSDICVLPYVYIERENWFRKANRFLQAKFLHRRYE